jgi:hypothetical protein
MKAKRCKSCREPFTPSRPLQSACGVQCAISLTNAGKEKARRDKEVRERREHRQAKEKVKTRGEHMRECQQAFNDFIRWRDRLAGHRCISSGRPLDWSGNAVDAGHYRSTGSSPHLRFDERNCHAQSKMDNRFLSGNAVDYRIGLIERIGLEAVELLEADQDPRKYTIDDLKAIKTEYRAKTRDLKKAFESVAQEMSS